MYDFNDLGVLTVTDASFAGEPGMKSQQGRMHFLCPFFNKSGIQSVNSSLFSQFPLLPPPSSVFVARRSGTTSQGATYLTYSSPTVDHSMIT